MAISDDVSQREFDKFMADADGNTIIRTFSQYGRYGSNLVRKTVVLTGAAGLGAVGQVSLFTVTGDVILTVWGECTDDFVSAGAGNVSVGTSTAAQVANLIAVTVATNVDNGDFWQDAGPGATSEAISAQPAIGIVSAGDDVIMDVTTSAVTAGTITFYCFWTPLSSGATVVAA